MSTAHLIKSFYIYNMICLLVSLFVVSRLSRKLQWSLNRTIMYIILLYINFPVLKNAIYNPTLTDISAFSGGILVLYFFINNNFKLLIISVFAMAFTWPSMLISSMPLILFRNLSLQEVDLKNKEIKSQNYPVFFFSVAVTLLVLYLYHSGYHPSNVSANSINKSLIISSFLMLFAYLYLSLRHFTFSKSLLFKDCYSYRELIFRIIVCLTLYLSVHFIIAYYESGVPATLTMWSYIKAIYFSSIVNPGTFLVSHIMKFGPGILLLIIFWRKVVSLIHSHGLGLVLFSVIALLMFVGPESREFINLWPFFAFLACSVIQEQYLTPSSIVKVLILALVTSRFWLSVNIAPWDASALSNLMKFPAQLFFMNSGPWMSNRMYLVFLMYIIVFSIAIYSIFCSNSVGES